MHDHSLGDHHGGDGVPGEGHREGGVGQPHRARNSRHEKIAAFHAFFDISVDILTINPQHTL